MNKKTLRIAGWALGLSMTVVGVSAFAALSAKTPIETNAASVTYAVGIGDFVKQSTAVADGDTFLLISYDSTAKK